MKPTDAEPTAPRWGACSGRKPGLIHGIRRSNAPRNAASKWFGDYTHAARLLWFDAPLAGLAISALLALNIAWEKTSALKAVSWFAAGLSMYFVVSRLCESQIRRRVVARALLLSGAVLAVYVVLQYRHLGYEVKFERIDMFGRGLSGFIPRMGTWTPFSNSVATFLEGLIPLGLALALSRGRQRWRIVSASATGIMAVALLLVASRGAWVAVAIAFLTWTAILAAPRRVSHRGALSTVGVVACALALLLTFSVVSGEPAAESILIAFDRPDRMEIFRNSLLLIGDFPFTGIGLGDQFAMALSRYALLIQVPFLTYSHNLYLDLWLELGLPGIVSWIFLLGAICSAVLAGERARLSTRFRGTWVGLLAVLVHGLSDARQSVDGWTWLPFFGLLGLLAAQLRRGNVTPGAWSLAPPAAAFTVLLVVAFSYVWPVRATWEANQGTLAQAKAELGDVGAADRAWLMSEARRHYDAAIELDARQATALRRVGILSIDGRRFPDARASLEAAWAVDRNNGATKKALGLAYTWTGDLRSGEPLLVDVPGIVEELKVWSEWWESQGQIAPAVNAARLSLRMEPDRVEVARRLARLERLLISGTDQGR